MAARKTSQPSSLLSRPVHSLADGKRDIVRERESEVDGKRKKFWFSVSAVQTASSQRLFEEGGGAPTFPSKREEKKKNLNSQTLSAMNRTSKEKPCGSALTQRDIVTSSGLDLARRN